MSIAIHIPDKIINALDRIGTKLDKAVRLVQYLQYFGYLIKDGEFSLEDLKDAVVRLQHDAGIVQDGEAGPKTLSVMDWPRCGCPENLIVEDASNPSKWGLSTLTYFIQARDSDLSASTWDNIIAQAFGQWENVCNLKFEQVSQSSKANLLIGIGSGARDNFDGPSGTLAWAYLPPQVNFKGQLNMKFDTGETWVDQSASRGIRLLNVATHEFGHMLGLSHSRVSSALMAPFYARDIIGPQNNDDIPRVQSLYGKPVIIPTVPTTPTVPTIPTAPDGETVIRLQGDINSISIDGYRIQKMS